MSKPSDKVPIKDIKYFNDTLNESQKQAIKFVLESPEVACIHGPPGKISPVIICYLRIS